MIFYVIKLLFKIDFLNPSFFIYIGNRTTVNGKPSQIYFRNSGHLRPALQPNNGVHQQFGFAATVLFGLLL
jgi:hypothetical protein